MIMRCKTLVLFEDTTQRSSYNDEGGHEVCCTAEQKHEAITELQLHLTSPRPTKPGQTKLKIPQCPELDYAPSNQTDLDIGA